MRRRKNLIIIGITIALCIVNQIVKNEISIEPIRKFCGCYFKDIVGSIAFMAYCNIVFCYYDRTMTKLWQIVLFMFFCGIFWEYITPLYRHNTVSDFWDVVAYIVGGIIYWVVARINYRRK